MTIEEYNHFLTGTYDKRTVPASNFTGYIHFQDPPPDVVNPPQPPPAPTPTPVAPTTGSTGSGSTGTGSSTGNPPSTGNPSSTPPSSPSPAPAPPQQTWAETAGGIAHTWTNYTNAGGTQGPSVGANQTVQIACKIAGFKVADGNTWWYRIASAPWNNTFYVSADAFYNNGHTSGSLVGTPFVDPAVANC